LRVLGPDGFDEVAIVDQMSGPTRPCPWLRWAKMFDDRPNFAFLMGTPMESGIAVPAGWSQEQSVKRSGQLLAPEQVSEHLEFVRCDGHLDVYRDRRTGQEWYHSRVGDDHGSGGPVGFTQ
jgi:hypothetical protein